MTILSLSVCRGDTGRDVMCFDDDGTRLNDEGSRNKETTLLLLKESISGSGHQPDDHVPTVRISDLSSRTIGASHVLL